MESSETKTLELTNDELNDLSHALQMDIEHYRKEYHGGAKRELSKRITYSKYFKRCDKLLERINSMIEKA